MQINLNPTSERGASRDAVNRPRETLGDSHLISSDPRSASGWYVTFFVAGVITPNVALPFHALDRVPTSGSATALSNWIID